MRGVLKSVRAFKDQKMKKDPRRLTANRLTRFRSLYSKEFVFYKGKIDHLRPENQRFRKRQGCVPRGISNGAGFWAQAGVYPNRSLKKE